MTDAEYNLFMKSFVQMISYLFQTCVRQVFMYIILSAKLIKADPSLFEDGVLLQKQSCFIQLSINNKININTPRKQSVLIDILKAHSLQTQHIFYGFHCIRQNICRKHASATLSPHLSDNSFSFMFAGKIWFVFKGSFLRCFKFNDKRRCNGVTAVRFIFIRYCLN